MARSDKETFIKRTGWFFLPPAFRSHGSGVASFRVLAVIINAPPWSAWHKHSSLYEDLADMPGMQGIHILDLKPFLLQQSRIVFEESGELLWWADDSHWNTKGHALVASFLSESIHRRQP